MRSTFEVAFAGLLIGVVACADGLVPCGTTAECGRGELCLDGLCQEAELRTDAGRDIGTDTGREAGGDARAPDVGVDVGTPDVSTDVGVPDTPPAGPCGAGGCVVFRLGPGSASWTGFDRGAGTFAPSAPIRAAFDIESAGLGYVLTDASYHVLRLSDRMWIAEGPRDALFPEASGVSLLVAYSVPADHGGGDGTHEGVTLQSVDSAYNYSLRLSDRTVTFTSRITDFGDAWLAPLAPPRPALLFVWLDTENSRGWAVGDPFALCGARPRTIGPYSGVVTATDVHVLEAGSCFEFSSRESNMTFAPFALPDAPVTSSIRAAFWNQGSLWLLRP